MRIQELCESHPEERTGLHQELISPCKKNSDRPESVWTDRRCLGKRRTHDMGVKVIAESHVDGLVHFRPEWRRDLWNVVRPDASLQLSLNLRPA